jgi:hypothetical protein
LEQGRFGHDEEAGEKPGSPHAEAGGQLGQQ